MAKSKRGKHPCEPCSKTGTGTCLKHTPSRQGYVFVAPPKLTIGCWVVRDRAGRERSRFTTREAAVRGAYALLRAHPNVYGKLTVVEVVTRTLPSAGVSVHARGSYRQRGFNGYAAGGKRKK